MALFLRPSHIVGCDNLLNGIPSHQCFQLTLPRSQVEFDWVQIGPIKSKCWFVAHQFHKFVGHHFVFAQWMQFVMENQWWLDCRFDGKTLVIVLWTTNALSEFGSVSKLQLIYYSSHWKIRLWPCKYDHFASNWMFISGWQIEQFVAIFLRFSIGFLFHGFSNSIPNANVFFDKFVDKTDHTSQRTFLTIFHCVSFRTNSGVGASNLTIFYLNGGHWKTYRRSPQRYLLS